VLGPWNSFCLLLSEKCINVITIYSLSRCNVTKETEWMPISSLSSKYSLFYNAQQHNESQNHIHFVHCHIFSLPNPGAKCERVDNFEISCWAYLLVSTTMSCSRAMSKMFSSVLATSNSVLLNLGPHSSQYVSAKWEMNLYSCHTNLVDSPPNLMFVFSTSCSSLPLSVLCNYLHGFLDPPVV
jgi:hypothetical protein